MQEDDTVKQLARKSIASTALSYLDDQRMPPAQILAAYCQSAEHWPRWMDNGPLALTTMLGVIGILPALFENRPPSNASIGAFIVVGLLVLATSLAGRFVRRAGIGRALRQMAWALPAAIPILVFRPFDLPSEVVSIGLFSFWGATYYVTPADAPSLKYALVITASCLYFALASLIAAGSGLTEPAMIFPVVGLLAVSLILLNTLGLHFSRAARRMELRARVQHDLLEIQRQELNELAETDELTGLSSRKQALEVLERTWRHYDEVPDERWELSLIMVDVDYLRQLNEHYGRHIGDVCLKRIASQLRTCARVPGDCVARYLGNSFLLVLHNQDERHAVRVGKQIREAVEAMNMLNPKSPSGWAVTVSVGVCGCVPRFGYEYTTAIQDVKSTLARAKAAGRNSVYSRQGLESTARGDAGASRDATQLMRDDTTRRAARTAHGLVH